MGWRFLLAVVSAAALASSVLGQDSAGFDLFLLVRTYPPGYCASSHCKLKPSSGFTIHGLWPEFDNGRWPQFCRYPPPGGLPSARGTSGISDGRDDLAESRDGGRRGAARAGRARARGLIAEGGASPAPRSPRGVDQRELDCEWPSLMGPNENFWDHEWSRHGTCAATVTGDRANFTGTVLGLHERYSLDRALHAAGITPSDERTYTPTQITGAVRQAFGVDPMLSCRDSALTEVWLCIGLDLQAFECPSRVRGGPRCGPEISLPTGPEPSPACRAYFPDWPPALRYDLTARAVTTVFFGALVLAAAAAAYLTLTGSWTTDDERAQSAQLLERPSLPSRAPAAVAVAVAEG